jgi:hypothetical protein
MYAVVYQNPDRTPGAGYRFGLFSTRGVALGSGAPGADDGGGASPQRDCAPRAARTHNRAVMKPSENQKTASTTPCALRGRGSEALPRGALGRSGIRASDGGGAKAGAAGTGA